MGKWVFSTAVFAFLILVIATEAKAVDYALPDTDDQMQSLDQYKGKWVIVNYWATWCSSCKEELPELIDFHESNKDENAIVVGINFESIERENLKEFVAENAIPYTVLRSEPVRNTPLGPVPALPVTYIVDPDGKVVAGEIGIVTRENLENYIAQKRG